MSFLFLLVIGFASHNLCAQEFLYPVAANDGQIYLLYQKSTTHLELWSWDPETLVGSKLLLSRHTPAGLQVLPNKSGFSFIDEGRIRIQYHDKRSAKALDIYEPIYDISVIHWIDAQSFYFSARENEKFGIFHVNVWGGLERLLSSQDCDYMYPSKVGGQLFYIKRGKKCGELHHVIMSAPYPVITCYKEPAFNCDRCFDERVEQLFDEYDK